MAEKKNDPLGYAVNEEDRKIAEKVQKRLTSGVSYKTSRGFYDEWAEYMRFWDTDQWPSATGDTQQFPRPVTNHFAEIIEMKVAGLNYELPDMYYEPKKGCLNKGFDISVQPLEQETEPFTIKPADILALAAESVWDHNDMDSITESLTRSGALLGDGLLYTYWDNDVQGSGEGGFIGEIAVTEIDVADFFVGDSHEHDIQKQPYIMVTERRPLSQVKAEYAEYTGAVIHIEAEGADKSVYDHEKLEQSETDYVNLVHYWERSIEEDEIEIEEVKVTQKKDAINYYVVCQDHVLREELDFYQSSLYPFARFSWLPRRKSFYSKSESKDLINNQKELNRLQGIALLGAYKTGLPNVRYKESFVKREDLSVGPGGNIIPDETPPGQGWGVDYMQPPTIASYIPLLKDSMAQGMKDTSGVHEAWSGKAPSAHLNASAIMALQEAAGVRIRGIQRRLYAALRDLGRIWLGYMMQYYTEDRMFKVYGKDNTEGLAWFRASDFQQMDFECKVAMNSASPYSKTVIASTLEGMVERGIIDAELYLKMLPPEVFPRIKELLELMQMRVEEQQQQLIEQQKQLVDEIVVQTIEQARAGGVEINPEALSQMMAMIQESAQKQEL